MFHALCAGLFLPVHLHQQSVMDILVNLKTKRFSVIYLSEHISMLCCLLAYHTDRYSKLRTIPVTVYRAYNAREC